MTINISPQATIFIWNNKNKKHGYSSMIKIDKSSLANKLKGVSK